jgi:hypothetical protein
VPRGRRPPAAARFAWRPPALTRRRRPPQRQGRGAAPPPGPAAAAAAAAGGPWRVSLPRVCAERESCVYRLLCCRPARWCYLFLRVCYPRPAGASEARAHARPLGQARPLGLSVQGGRFRPRVSGPSHYLLVCKESSPCRRLPRPGPAARATLPRRRPRAPGPGGLTVPRPGPPLGSAAAFILIIILTALSKKKLYVLSVRPVRAGHAKNHLKVVSREIPSWAAASFRWRLSAFA